MKMNINETIWRFRLYLFTAFILVMLLTNSVGLKSFVFALCALDMIVYNPWYILRLQRQQDAKNAENETQGD